MSTKVKAYAVNRIQTRNDKGEKAFVPAKSVFDIGKPEFDRLERLGAVRKPTEDELAVAAARSGRVPVVPAQAEVSETKPDETKQDTGNKKPASGERNDPNNTPKKAKGTAGKKADPVKQADASDEKAADAKTDDSGEDDGDLDI